MRTGEQAQTVLKRVEAATDLLNRTLPKDVRVEAFYDRSELIHLHDTALVADNLLRGIVLVVVVLVFFLYDVRSGLIVAATIPLSLLFAFILPRPSRQHPGEPAVDRSTDFGILVDASVVMVENIHRQLRESAARDDLLHTRCHCRRGGPGRPPDRVRRRGHRNWLPADLCAVGSIRPALHADGRYDDLRPDRLVGSWRSPLSRSCVSSCSAKASGTGAIRPSNGYASTIAARCSGVSRVRASR